MAYWRISQRVRRQLREHLGWERTWCESEFTALLERSFPEASETTLKKVLDAAARAAYWHRSDCPTPCTTVKDDASASAELTPEEQGCWWHEARLFEDLLLPWPWQQQLRDRFLRCYWKLYRQINQGYRAHPTPERARQLEDRFVRLLSCRTDCPALNQRMALTLAKKQRMLTVLRYPAVPMHNNGEERALRSRARKRDVSYGTRSESGVRAWDTMQGLCQTRHSEPHGAVASVGSAAPSRSRFRCTASPNRHRQGAVGRQPTPSRRTIVRTATRRIHWPARSSNTILGCYSRRDADP